MGCHGEKEGEVKDGLFLLKERKERGRNHLANNVTLPELVLLIRVDYAENEPDPFGGRHES